MSMSRVKGVREFNRKKWVFRNERKKLNMEF
jgi:hypothetical protein